MKVLHVFLFLIISTFIFLNPCTANTCQINDSIKTEQTKCLKNDFLSSFDQIISFIEKIESEDFNENFHLDELKNINSLLSHFAREGILTDDYYELLNLEEDIDELLSNSDEKDFFSDYSMQSPYLFSPSEIILCSSFWKHPLKKTAKFVRKHKKAILIGAAVVTAATVTTVIVINSKKTTTSDSQDTPLQLKIDESNHQANESLSISNSQETLSLNLSEFKNEENIFKNILDEQIAFAKNNLPKEMHIDHNNLSPSEKLTFWDQTKITARDFGAHLSHEVLQEVADITKIVPNFLKEVQDCCSTIIPENLLTNPSTSNESPLFSNKDPIETFEEILSEGHNKIDQIFAVNQKDKYSKEAKENPLVSFDVGILPFPNSLLKETLNFNKLADAGKVCDRAGLTKAGRALAKHGGRKGSVFPKPSGNPSQINAQGQEILENILNHPNKKIFRYTFKEYGEIIDIKVPEIGGLRYNIKGEFIGFLEP